MAADFQFARIHDSRPLRASSLAELLAVPRLQEETWLFVSPHDDDLCVGAGLWLQAAVKAGVDVRVIVITDGRMGYCSIDQRDAIVAIRHAECLESFAILGIPADHILHAGFPDASLNHYTGRRVARHGDPEIAGCTGIENALAWQLRATRPTRVFVPTRTDLHPDHQITNNELMISSTFAFFGGRFHERTFQTNRTPPYIRGLHPCESERSPTWSGCPKRRSR